MSELKKLVEKWRTVKTDAEWPGAEYFNDARNACAEELAAWLPAHDAKVRTETLKEASQIVHPEDFDEGSDVRLALQAVQDAIMVAIRALKSRLPELEQEKVATPAQRPDVPNPYDLSAMKRGSLNKVMAKE